MLKRKIALTFIVLTILPLLPVLTSVHAMTYETFNVGVAGSGKVYWSSSYDQGYDTGWVDNCASIALAKGATVTFTAVPVNDHQFSNWVINGVDKGTNNPFTIYNTGKSSKVNLVANFDQTFYANPPLQSPLHYDAIQVNAQGSGRVYWSSSYGARYDSGSTGTSSSIIVPHGATVTFTAVPMNGTHFNEWMVDSANQGPNNPYVVHSMYVSQSTSVVAVFTQG